MDAPEKEVKEDLKGLYDLAVPLGTPVSVIREIADNFDLDLVWRQATLETALEGETVDREVLVFRGDLETIKEARKFMLEALEKAMNRWNEKNDRYRAQYEARLKEAALEKEKDAQNQDDASDVKPSDLVP